MLSLTRLVKLLFLAALVLAFLVWGLPWVRGTLPRLCEQRGLSTGVCAERILTGLEHVDAWTERVLRPHARDIHPRDVLQRAYSALSALEQAARKGLGDETMDAAFRGADVALGELEKVFGGEARQKVGDIPENAQRLVADARDALERLRTVLLRTGRRAEDVTRAVDDTRKALDALSNVLPK